MTDSKNHFLSFYSVKKRADFNTAVEHLMFKCGELGDISPAAELSANGKLAANWHSVVEDSVLTPERATKKSRPKQ